MKNDKMRCKAVCTGGNDCQWQATCRKLGCEDTWQLRSCLNTHTCSRALDNPVMSSTWLSESLDKKLRYNPKMRLSHIRNMAKEKWNCNLSKTKACRARKKALLNIKGSMAEQFRRINDYLEDLNNSNEGSTVKLVTQRRPDYDAENEKEGDEPNFKRLYVCLNACKQSFKSCRNIIGLDGCFLKAGYGCQLLSAVGRDPNDQMLPLAIAIVEIENKDTWTWFLELLLNDLGPTALNGLCIMSDQQKV